MRNTYYLFFLLLISSMVCSLMILADTVLRASYCNAEDKAVIFTHPKDGAKLTTTGGHCIFKGRVVGFDKKEIKDLDLKVLLFKKKVDVRGDGTWTRQKKLPKGEHPIKVILIDKNYKKHAEATIKITIE